MFIYKENQQEYFVEPKAYKPTMVQKYSPNKKSTEKVRKKKAALKSTIRSVPNDYSVISYVDKPRRGQVGRCERIPEEGEVQFNYETNDFEELSPQSHGTKMQVARRQLK